MKKLSHDFLFVMHLYYAIILYMNKVIITHISYHYITMNKETFLYYIIILHTVKEALSENSYSLVQFSWFFYLAFSRHFCIIE